MLNLKVWYFRYITINCYISEIPSFLKVWYMRNSTLEMMVYEIYRHFFMVYAIFVVKLIYALKTPKPARATPNPSAIIE